MIRHFLIIEPKSGESKDITGIDVTFSLSRLSNLHHQLPPQSL